MSIEKYKNTQPQINKLLNSDGTITTLTGEIVDLENAVEKYKNTQPQINKMLNPDGTITELSGGTGGSSANPTIDSMAIQQPNIGELEVINGKVYRFIEAVGGGDISWYANGTLVTLNCTTNPNLGIDASVTTVANGRAVVEISQGTATNDKISITCAILDMDDGDTEAEADILLANFEGLPEGTFLPISIDSIQDHVNVGFTGAIVSQRTTECIAHNGQGAISRMRENMRLTINGNWWAGCDTKIAITTNVGTKDGLNVIVNPGEIYQLHRQSFPLIQTSTNGIFLVKTVDSDASMPNFTKVNDLNALTMYDNGDTIASGDCFIVDIYGHINNTPENCKIFAMLPKHKFTSEADALHTAETSNFGRMPWTSRTVGFPIARLVLKYDSADGGTYTNVVSNTSYDYTVWESHPFNFTSPNYPNNYPINSDISQIINHAGAEKIRVRFQTFNTETNYDFVKFTNNINGYLYNTYSGNLGTYWYTNTFATSSLKIRFTSDTSVGRTGFKIISYDALMRYSGATNGTKVIDMRK